MKISIRIVVTLFLVLVSGCMMNPQQIDNIDYKINNIDYITIDENYSFPIDFKLDDFKSIFINKKLLKIDEKIKSCPESYIFYSEYLSEINKNILELKNEQKFRELYFNSVDDYFNKYFYFHYLISNQYVSTDSNSSQYISTDFINRDQLMEIINSEDFKISDENIVMKYRSDKVKDNLWELNFIYTFKYGFKHFDIGKDIITLTIDTKNINFRRLKEGTLKVIDIDKFYDVIIYELGQKNVFLEEYLCKSLMEKYKKINEKYELVLKELNDKVNIVREINDKKLFCYLIEKDLSFYEDKHDLSIEKIDKTQFKTKTYFSLNILYLNIFNNINIKFNDQYKISRYLFDNLVRKGIRVFSDIFEVSPEIDGIHFKIVGSDKNFIEDSDPSNFSVYEFYIPKKESLLYIENDITGKDLSDNSYILVNNERIELR